MYLQGIGARNLNSWILRCYGKAKYAFSPHTHHTTFVFICCTLHVQSGKTVRRLARKSLPLFMPQNFQKTETKQLEFIQNLAVYTEISYVPPQQYQ